MLNCFFKHVQDLLEHSRFPHLYYSGVLEVVVEGGLFVVDIDLLYFF